MDDDNSDQFESADEGLGVGEKNEMRYPSSDFFQCDERNKSEFLSSKSARESDLPSSALKLNSGDLPAPIADSDSEVVLKKPELNSVRHGAEKEDKRCEFDMKLFLESEHPESAFPPTLSVNVPTVKELELNLVHQGVDKENKDQPKDRRSIEKCESDRVPFVVTENVELTPPSAAVDDESILENSELRSAHRRLKNASKGRRKGQRNVVKCVSDGGTSVVTKKVESPSSSAAAAGGPTLGEPESSSLHLKVEKKNQDSESFRCSLVLSAAKPCQEDVLTPVANTKTFNLQEPHSVNHTGNQSTDLPDTSCSVVKKSRKKVKHDKHCIIRDRTEPSSVSPSRSSDQEAKHVESIELGALPDNYIQDLVTSKRTEFFDALEAKQTVPVQHQTDNVGTENSTASAESSEGVKGILGNKRIHSPEFISTTTTHIVRGVGGGLNMLADAFAQVVNFGANSDDNDPELFDRRRRRALEERAEREALTEAWSNVWNTAWGTNDGWDVEEASIPETHDDSPIPCTLSTDTATDPVCSKPSDSQAQDAVNSQPSAFWDWSGVSSFAQQITSSFQTTGLNLVHEGVNVLEKIGKKTMSVIEENDPGFQYTKTLLRPPGFQERPNLSEVIREAHKRQETEKSYNSLSNESNRGNFTAQLENRRALVHMEALELVSDKAESQLHIQLDGLSDSSCLHDELNLDRGILEVIWRTLHLDIVDDEDENTSTGFPDQSTWKILKCKKQQLRPYGTHPAGLSEKNSLVWIAFERSVSLVKTIYPGEKLLRSMTDVWNDMKKVEDISAEELYFTAIDSLAEVTSAFLEYLHKFSECALVRTHKPTADFERLTSILAIMFRAAMMFIGALCSEYNRAIKLAHKSQGEVKPTKSASHLVGSLLLECANAQAYLRNTAHLLVPILQLACVNTKRAATEAD